MSEKVLFVYNPNAGKGIIKNKLSSIIEIFMQNDLDVNIFATLAKDDAKKIVEQKCKDGEYKRVICSGGDGTLHEVVNALMSLRENSRPVCGYIPAGTVNDFARGLRLPKRVTGTAPIAAGSHYKSFDIGDMNGEAFTYVAAFGAFTSVSYDTSQQFKNKLGSIAYLFQGIGELGIIKSTHVKVTTDDEIWEDDVILGMVTNSKSVGGMNLFSKRDIRPDDGYFEAIFIKTPQNPIELNRIMGSLIFSDIGPQIKAFRSRSYTIETSESTAYTIDGENGGMHRKVTITAHRQALRFYCK